MSQSCERCGLSLRTKTMSLCDKKIPLLDAEITMPVFEGLRLTRAEKRLNGYYALYQKTVERRSKVTLFRRAKKAHALAMKENRSSSPCRLTLSHTVVLEQDGVLSLLRDHSETHGGAKGVSLRSSDNWNMYDGFPLTLESLLPKGKKSFKAVFAALRAGFEGRQAREGAVFFDKLSSLIRRRFRPDNYFLTPEGIGFFFQAGEVAPVSEGVRSAVIPYRALGMERPVLSPPNRRAIRDSFPRFVRTEI